MCDNNFILHFIIILHNIIRLSVVIQTQYNNKRPATDNLYNKSKSLEYIHTHI